MEFKQYPSYKPSGVEWLGDVPEHWEVKKIKRISPVNRGASPRPINDLKYFDDNGEYAWVRISDVTRSNGFLFETEQRLSSLGASFSVKLEPESLFLSIAATVGKPCITKIKTCIHDGFVYFPKLNKHRDLLFNIFESKLCFVGLGKLGTQLNLNSETVEDIYVAIPPESEEKAILGYIQTETTRIDNLIAKQEKLIELLEEQRKSIISHAVTKGLNPNAPMKDSGVEWLGDVPESWEVIPSKFYFTERKEKAVNGDKQLTASQKHGIIYQDEFIAENGRVMVVMKNPEILKKVRPNDFVISMRSFQGGLELSSLEGSISSAYVMLKPDLSLINTEYFKYLFKTPRYIQSLQSTSNLIRDGQALRFNNFSQVKLVLPPKSEQQEIVEYLDKEKNKIDNLIYKQKTLIEKLKEYRASIISHAVTGKIDVREFGA